MNPAIGPALAEALALARAPRSPRPGPQARLPDGMLMLLKLAAGEEQALGQARESTGERREAIHEAAVFYVQQVMFATGSNSYRVLGVDSDATDERIREHFRWLARWLHPDRNTDGWDVVYAERVNTAWQDLRSPERRLRYDQSLATPIAAPEVEYSQREPISRLPAYADESLATPRFRWLPATIFSALGLAALGTVLLFSALWWAETDFDAAPPVPTAEIVIVPTPVVVDPGQAPAELVVAQAPAPPVAEAGNKLVVPPLPPLPVPMPQVSDRIAESHPARTPHLEAARTSDSAAVSVVSAPKRELARSSIEPRSLAEPEARSTAMSTPAPATVRVAIPMPDSRASASPEPPTPRPQIDEREANRLLGHFSRAYSDGNLADMRAMFTSDIQGPRGGIEEILREYDQLFSASLDRSLAVRDVSWFANGGTLTIIASYQATVAPGKNRRPRITHGDLRMDLRREDNQWRIYRLQHEERRG